MVKTISLSSAASRGLSTQTAPASSSGSAFSGVRFQTWTVWPASSSRRTIAVPMPPSPTYPNSATPSSGVDVVLHAHEMVAHLVACALGVTRGDRSADRAVLDDRALRAVRDAHDRHERPADHV